jgi:IS5 family transposase
MTDVSPEAFAAVANLIAVIADPKGCAKRLAELQARMGAVTAAQTKLDADARTVAADRAAADEHAKAVREREVKAALAERDLIADREALVAERRALAAERPRFSADPNLGPGGRSYSGLTREPYTNG